MTLSPAARIVLSRAAERPDHRLEFHRKLPALARGKMIDALLARGLIDETEGDYRLGDGAVLVEDAASGLMLTTLRITDAGLAAVGHQATATAAATAAVPDTATDADRAPQAASDKVVAQEAAAVADAIGAAPPARTSLRQAAQAVLTAWDGEANRDADISAALAAPMDALRALLARAGRPTRQPGTARQGSKKDAVLAILRHGASVDDIAEATSWNPNTVRGFLAGLKKQGFPIAATGRVSPHETARRGNKGRRTIYHLGG